MPKPIDIKSIPVEHPAEGAWKKYAPTLPAYSHTVHSAFMAGWDAALDWIPVRIAQFREIEEDLRKEIEELKKNAK